MDLLLPYKVGDLAELKSFEEGYRGAWFRCKIIDMRVTESGHLECYLDYIDYPGENKEWIRLYQNNPACSKQQSTEQIMLRPSFPRWYLKDQVPEQFPDDDDIAIVHGSWKVGDMIDWLSEGCYWSGRITELVNEDMVEVELLQPPLGEGQCYKASRKELRPTLDWSLVRGWTVPLSQEKGKGQHVVCVIHRQSTGRETSESNEDDGGKDYNSGDDGDSQDVQLRAISSNTSPGSPIPQPSSAAKSMPSLKTQEDAALTCTTDLRPSSSQSHAPTQGAEPAASSQAGVEVTEKLELADIWDDMFQQLDELASTLKRLTERVRLEEERGRAALAALR